MIENRHQVRLLMYSCPFPFVRKHGTTWDDAVGRGLEVDYLLVVRVECVPIWKCREWYSPGNLTRAGEQRIRRRKKGRHLERPCNVLVFWMKVVGPKEYCRWKAGRRSDYGRVNESEYNEATQTKWTWGIGKSFPGIYTRASKF